MFDSVSLGDLIIMMGCTAHYYGLYENSRYFPLNSTLKCIPLAS